MEVKELIGGTHGAIEKILASAANKDAAPPLQLTVDDLAKAYNGSNACPCPRQLLESARRWVRDGRITIVPNKTHPSDYCCGRGEGSMRWWYYVATVNLADGSDLMLSFQPAANGERFPHLHTYVHWLGAKGQEEILPNW
jgi:hypothetical protein